MPVMKSSNFFSSRSIFVLILLCAAINIAAPAQTYTELADFSYTTSGGYPASPLTQGLDGNFYGTAQYGGAYNLGTFFQVTPSGTLTVLHDFCFSYPWGCPDGPNDGAYPSGQIALGVDGNFYGTTQGTYNAAYGNGTIYKITPEGSLTILYVFSLCTSNCSAFPGSGLTLARDGVFYGVSGSPLATPDAFDDLVFWISSSGTFTNLLFVCPDQICPTNAGPYGTLLQANAGNLIGPGPGGANGEGAIYKMTPSGTPTVLYSFCADSTCHDGYQTTSPLVEAPGGDFYGTNVYGGSGTHCTLAAGCGTAFRVTFDGTLTKLHDFCSWASCADGATPNALILATDGNFYGSTPWGGTSNQGTVFSLTPSGRFTLIHTFSGTEGSRVPGPTDPPGPTTVLYQGTDGNLYGTTNTGGNGAGTIFRISLGLPSFVRTVQNFGAVGAAVIILGNNLTGATGVTFNGATAAFSVVSDTEITATVPAGATTGSIQVVTAGSGTLSSNVAFVVLP
jgi:uncharacterized repeat protein (TIGR03803 family)